MKVVAAVKRELTALRKRDPKAAASPIAATALELAAQLDDPDVSASAKAACARELRETLDRLPIKVPVRTPAPAPKKPEKKERVYDLQRRRQARRARASGT